MRKKSIRGGARVGAGRKPDPTKAGRRKITVLAPYQVVARFRAAAQASGMDQGAYFAACVEAKNKA
jgi:hypothetical protein